jgi:hypothetical protein
MTHCMVYFHLGILFEGHKTFFHERLLIIKMTRKEKFHKNQYDRRGHLFRISFTLKSI